MKKKIFKSRGFTTFELLVVIFVIALISSMLIVSWRKGERRYQVESAAQEIVQNIRKVQDMALNSFKYDLNSPPPLYYGIHFSRTDYPNSYIIFADTNEDQRCCSNDLYTEEIAVLDNIEIYYPCKQKPGELEREDDAHITFSLPDGFTTVDRDRPDTTGFVIRIIKTGGTCPQDCKAITIEKNGRVSAGDWMNCDGDP